LPSIRHHTSHRDHGHDHGHDHAQRPSCEQAGTWCGKQARDDRADVHHQADHLPGAAGHLPGRSGRVLYSQNFLRDARLVDRLLDGSTIGRDDLVVEIGPGTGTITERLAARCGQVVAVERDPALVRHLLRRFDAAPRVAIHEGSFLDFALPHAPYKVFANIPFNVTAAIVARLTDAPRPPDDAYLVMQREAAARFQGRPQSTLVAALLWPWFDLTVTYRFDRRDFSPPPGVEAVMLRLRKRGPPLIENEEAQSYRDFVTHCFTAWRPGLRHVFTRRQLVDVSRRLGLTLHTEPHATPATIPVAHWPDLHAYFVNVADTHTRQIVAGSEERLRYEQAGLQRLHRTRASHPYRPPSPVDQGQARETGVFTLPRSPER